MMVALIEKCGPCSMGKHEQCDNKTGAGKAPPGVFGGHICQCIECREQQMPEQYAKFSRQLRKMGYELSRKRGEDDESAETEPKGAAE